MKRTRLLGGLLVRKERWTLSRVGGFLVLLLCLGVVLAALYGIYPFLAAASPVKSETLVVEGWLPRQGLEQTVALVQTVGLPESHHERRPGPGDLGCPAR